MGQYDIPISAKGGFSSLAEAMAHHQVIGRLEQAVASAASAAEDLRSEDQVEIGATPSELHQDLAPGLGHVIMLSQPEGQPLLGGELRYRPEDGQVLQLTLDLGESRLNQVGRTYKLEESGTTTFFQKDEQRGVFTVVDPDHEVPALFQGADPNKLIGGTLQLNPPILLF